MTLHIPTCLITKIIICIIMVFIYCKNSTIPDTTNIVPKNVYIAGGASEGLRHNMRACYWKNNERIFVGDSSSFSYAWSLTIIDRDVYVTGVEYPNMLDLQTFQNNLHQNKSTFAQRLEGNYTTAVYWKNGIKSVLPSQTKAACAYDIAYNGGDIYIVGEDSISACFWKNGIKTNLTNEPLRGVATGIAVQGNDIYISGGYGSNACYWKNEIRTNLTSDSYQAGAFSVSLKEGDLHFVGRSDNYGCYWKNNIVENITDGNFLSFILGIDISTKDIYLSGVIIKDTLSEICYWKNKEKTLLGTGNENIPLSIALLDTNILVSCWDQKQAQSYYWKNGQKILLGDSSFPYTYALRLKIF